MVIETGLNILRWRFDIFERYQFCVKHLNKKDFSILEIGAGEYGLEYFGFKSITTTDINGQQKYLDITKPLSANFPQFDTVVAIDVIEHIAPQKRTFAINQVYGLAKRKIFLSIPNGLIAYKLDKKLNKFLNKKGYHPQHLKEHIKYGIFDAKGLTKKLSGMSRTKKVKIFNGIDIKAHEKLARFLCHKSKPVFLLKNKLLYPIRNLVISRIQSNTPYHKYVEVTLN